MKSAINENPTQSSFPRTRDKSAPRVERPQDGPKGERSESSRAESALVRPWIPAFAGMTGIKYPQLFKLILVIAVCSVPLVAEAHPGHAGLALRDGFLHPWLGWDHLLSMLAVGLWARQLQRASGSTLLQTLQLPALFVAAVAAGALAGHQFGSSGLIETLIASSLIGLGALLAVARTLPRGVAAALTLPMGLVHGWAHGAEMATDAPMLPFFAGFILATAVLHLCGLALASAMLNRSAAIVLRAAGVGIAAAGCGLLAAI